MDMERLLLTGNEAVAFGAFEAGVSFCSAYPGTPSTEILENIAAKYSDDIYAEWAPNEKVALESAIGASLAGVRSLAAMKHVGLNVAADPLFTLSYTGVTAGLVIVSADDPGMHSSQNEQDNRNYAKAAKVLMLEPSNSQEAKDFTVLAFELSERFDTPVLLRLTTRVCHSKSVVCGGVRKTKRSVPYKKDIAKYVATPANAIIMRGKIEEREEAEKLYAASSKTNRSEWKNPARTDLQNTLVTASNMNIGVICSGIAYEYAKEVFGDSVSYLKLGVTYPIADETILDFAKQVGEVIVIEETDPYLEFHVKSLGVACVGKTFLPKFGELSQDIIKKAFKARIGSLADPFDLPSGRNAKPVPPRPPVLCAGCPHRGFFVQLAKKKGVMVTGDIGCYTLASAPPLAALDTCFCMGAAFSTAHGGQVGFRKTRRKTRAIGVMGDSTFFHTGINSLMNIAYNRSNAISVILDNRITAMTGQQENPGTGKTLSGADAGEVSIQGVCKALGFAEDKVTTVDPLNASEVSAALNKALEDKENPYVIIAKSPCVLKKMDAEERKEYKLKGVPLKVIPEKCIACKKCLAVGCPAISLAEKADIDEISCNGCGVCASVCPVEAIG